MTADTVHDGRGGRLAAVVRLLRPHQWAKNALVFVPLFTAVAWDSAAAWRAAAIAFAALCLAASAGYVANDLTDVDRDRAHPRKRGRPLPSGLVPLGLARVLVVALALAALLVANLVGTRVVVLVALYLATTLVYTTRIKQYVLADVLALAGLYTLRIVVGTVAIGHASSLWLLSFSMFLFFSLALVKRFAELDPERALEGRKFGRDYALVDVAVVLALGVCSGLLAVLVMALYVDSQAAQLRYASPHWLWLTCPVIWYWIGRCWFKAARREMHDDPIVFALRDRASWLCLAAIAALWFAAVRGVPAPFA